MKIESIHTLTLTTEECIGLHKFLGNFSDEEKGAKGLTKEQGYMLSDLYGLLCPIVDNLDEGLEA